MFSRFAPEFTASQRNRRYRWRDRPLVPIGMIPLGIVHIVGVEEAFRESTPPMTEQSCRRRVGTAEGAVLNREIFGICNRLHANGQRRNWYDLTNTRVFYLKNPGCPEFNDIAGGAGACPFSDVPRTIAEAVGGKRDAVYIQKNDVTGRPGGSHKLSGALKPAIAYVIAAAIRSLKKKVSHRVGGAVPGVPMEVPLKRFNPVLAVSICKKRAMIEYDIVYLAMVQRKTRMGVIFGVDGFKI